MKCSDPLVLPENFIEKYQGQQRYIDIIAADPETRRKERLKRYKNNMQRAQL